MNTRVAHSERQSQEQFQVLSQEDSQTQKIVLSTVWFIPVKWHNAESAEGKGTRHPGASFQESSLGSLTGWVPFSQQWTVTTQWNVAYRGSSLESQHPEILLGLDTQPPCASCAYQKSRLPEGKQVFGKKHTVCTNIQAQRATLIRQWWELAQGETQTPRHQPSSKLGVFLRIAVSGRLLICSATHFLLGPISHFVTVSQIFFLYPPSYHHIKWIFISLWLFPQIFKKYVSMPI